MLCFCLIPPDTPRLKCPKCPRSFPTDCQLRHHMKGHGSDTPFLCDTCGFTTIHFGSMNVHRKLHDGKMALHLLCAFHSVPVSTMRREATQARTQCHSRYSIATPEVGTIP